jgi:chaperonin GroES
MTPLLHTPLSNSIRSFDLDDDGYEEPYIVTFHRESGTVLRIVARFDELGLKTDNEGKVVRIEPIQYYTKFGFIPNPDGSFYDIGFGVLLGPNQRICQHPYQPAC